MLGILIMTLITQLTNTHTLTHTCMPLIKLVYTFSILQYLCLYSNLEKEGDHVVCRVSSLTLPTRTRIQRSCWPTLLSSVVKMTWCFVTSGPPGWLYWNSHLQWVAVCISG